MKNYGVLFLLLFIALYIYGTEPLSNIIPDYSNNQAGSEYFQRFLEYYDINFKDIDIDSEYINFKQYSIIVYHFKPENPLGTVFLVHGYYDHVGIQKNLIKELLQNRYEIITFDLPGHGLSSGKRADIDTFDTYSGLLTHVIRESHSMTKNPYHLVGHSTGAAAIINILLEKEIKDISKIVLVSPLIRSNHWTASIIGTWTAGLFTDEISRKFRNNSSNMEYLYFIRKRDFLQHKKFPLNWFRALKEWNSKIVLKSKSSRDIMVIQGTSDSTVDWVYNLDFIKEKFPNSNIIKISNAEHQLYNETPEIRKGVFNSIVTYLKK